MQKIDLQLQKHSTFAICVRGAGCRQNLNKYRRTGEVFHRGLITYSVEWKALANIRN